MGQFLTSAVHFTQHLFNTINGQSTLPLMVVAGYAGGAVVLYGLTKGKEFLIAGYSSVLFLAPFIHLS